MSNQNLAGISDAKIKDLIKAMQLGLDVASPGSEEKKTLQKSINRALEELTRRNQKKDDAPQSAPPPPKPAQRVEVPKQEEKRRIEQPAQPQGEIKPVLLRNVLTKVAPPTIPVQWASGKVKEMTEAELKRKAIDYFLDVLDSAADVSEFYRSIMFNNIVRFCIGLYRFGNEMPEHLTLHPTYNLCSDAVQERSAELYRQVKEAWQEFKDLEV